MHQIKYGSVLEVDIHGMTAGEAKRGLEQILSRADKDITELRVIHGYNSGQVLRDMVRRQLKHPRISAKLISLNPGETRILLK
nr:Smr/MutS family protein [uncultured Caproiciproducens sp.]